MLADKTIYELSVGLKNKQFSSEELVNECYDAIERLNPSINAFTTIHDRNETTHVAKEKDKNYSKDKHPLYGLPFVIKDAFNTQGIQTTAASNVLKNYIPVYNATVYQKIIDTGAILIGKTNMYAWGHGASSENTDFGAVKNPWNTTRVAGGSSGGNAAAIASRMTVFGIGEDTGGSIRNPSAWCNITGLKVSYGRTSRYGAIAYVSSFDAMGPMAKTAQDCAYILQVISGRDPYDATSSPHEVPDYVERIKRNVKGLILGMPKECFGKGLDSEIKKSIEKAALEFQKLEMNIKEISMPMLDYGVS